MEHPDDPARWLFGLQSVELGRAEEITNSWAKGLQIIALSATSVHEMLLGFQFIFLDGAGDRKDCPLQNK
jgi:hypothetical protein